MTRQNILLPVLPVKGFTGNSLKAEPGAHPPPTVNAGHPVQGEGHQGSHPPDQEDSAAKPFWTTQVAQSWSWSSSQPGASARNEIKTYKTLKTLTKSFAVTILSEYIY